MADWRDDLLDLARSLGERVGRAAGAIDRAVDRDPYHVVGYRGYATSDRALVLGRVLQDEGVRAGEEGQGSWRNLMAMLRRLESDPLPHAHVRLRMPGADRELVADDEGFLHEWVPLAAPPAPGVWHSAELELVDVPRVVPGTTIARLLAPSNAASFGVISDLDDTVLQSHVHDFLRAARVMLLESARTRLPFPGVAAFYRALEIGASGVGGSAGSAAPVNPIFYVSSSPWNIYDVVTDFLAGQRIPTGPVLLRDWDMGRALLRNAGHKMRLIGDILAAYPRLGFLLIGDSGQEDPEIYTEVVRRHPGRILAIYIRNVSPRPDRAAAIRDLAVTVAQVGSTLVLADDTLAAARHAAAHGWIDSASLDEIGWERDADEGARPGKADSPGVAAPPAPTIVVDPDVDAGDVERPR